ncbi:unnamed protein product [Allacma fusca]|uniref:Phosphatidic acid phosphatase type 2/haloperoxidase domain-containing protein n=1 Tax=Allacma fusca TaxID=39272 RepID=A0A8J2KA22_9HEXA|nr:unnamed protein product [Allacma fusca]
MYIGQGLKDIICWPRPASPPVIRLEKKWELEYGMPSTHAMTGAAVPFSILIFTSCRYEYPFLLGVFFSLLWCALVCSSRIYLGMHSVLDVVAGLSLVALLFLWVIPVVDWLDPIILTDEFGALYMLSGAILLALCSPGGDRWTPARGDTVVILGSAVGLITGAWMNYQLGIISSNGPAIDMPFPVMWPSYKMLGLSLLRLVIGLCIVLITRQIAKSTTKTFFAGLVQSKNISCVSNPTSREIFVELSNKFVTYLIVGFNIVFLAPRSTDTPGLYRRIPPVI